MLFQKETKIRDMINQAHLLQNRMDTGFAPIGMDMPYRIIVINNLTKVTDAAGGVTTYTIHQNAPQAALTEASSAPSQMQVGMLRLLSMMKEEGSLR